jgi:hypothetical protein
MVSKIVDFAIVKYKKQVFKVKTSKQGVEFVCLRPLGGVLPFYASQITPLLLSQITPHEVFSVFI